MSETTLKGRCVELSAAQLDLKEAERYQRQCNDALTDAHSNVKRATKRLRNAERAIRDAQPSNPQEKA